MEQSPADKRVVAGFDFLGKRAGIRILLEVRNIAWALDSWDIMRLHFLLQKLFPVQTIEPSMPLDIIHP